MVNFILSILVFIYLSFFVKRHIKAFIGKVEAVTPSYKIYFDKLGNISIAKCKKTGKFVKIELACIELESYFI